MIYVCAELIINGQHGYRLVNDTFETMDAPDKSIDELIKQGKLSRSHKKADLPLIENKVIKRKSDILTFIKRDNDTIICTNYKAERLEISGIDIEKYKFWNANIVEFMRPGCILSKTLLGINESYKQMVDTYYIGREMEVSQEKIQRSIAKSSMISTNYIVGTDGVLQVKPGNEDDRLIIPDGVVDTQIIKGYGLVVGSRSLNRINIGDGNKVIDLRKCNNLIEVVFDKNTRVDLIYWNENITSVSSFETPLFEDWKLLLYKTRNFINRSFNTMTLKNSIIQESIPDQFCVNCTINHLVIGGGIKIIGKGSFIYIRYAESINFGNTVEKIGSLAFGQSNNDSTMLRKTFEPVKIIRTDSIKHIGDYAFNGMGLLDLDFKNMCKLTHIGKNAFHGCKFKNGIVYLPNSVKIVGANAFDDIEIIRLSRNLTEKSVKHILKNYNLRIVIVPKELKEVAEKYLLSGCCLRVEKE